MTALLQVLRKLCSIFLFFLCIISSIVSPENFKRYYIQPGRTIGCQRDFNLPSQLALQEFLTIKCRPYYLPRELSSLIVTAIFIPPARGYQDGHQVASLDIMQTGNHISWGCIYCSWGFLTKLIWEQGYLNSISISIAVHERVTHLTTAALTSMMHTRPSPPSFWQIWPWPHLVAPLL
jgi:hypothetical protein